MYLRSVYKSDREWIGLPRKSGWLDSGSGPDAQAKQRAFQNDSQGGSATDQLGFSLGQYLRIAIYVWLLALVLSIAKDLIYQYFVSAPATPGDASYLNLFLKDFVNDALPRRLVVQTAYAGLVAALICYCLDVSELFGPSAAAEGRGRPKLGADDVNGGVRDADSTAVARSVQRMRLSSAFSSAFLWAAVIAMLVVATLLATAAYNYYNELVDLKEDGTGEIRFRASLLIQQAVSFFFFAFVYAFFVLAPLGRWATDAASTDAASAARSPLAGPVRKVGRRLRRVFRSS